MVTYAWKSYFIHNVRIEYVQKLIMKCLIYGRSRQSPFPFPIQLAKPGVPITARIGGDIFQRIDRVTCLRRAERCTSAQSGSAGRRGPGLRPALAKSRCSSIASVKPASNGQAAPAASQRRSGNRTVDDATPTRRAISRVEIPAPFNLRHSRTWRIDILSIGIGDPPWQSRKSGP